MTENGSYPAIEKFGSESQLKSYLLEAAEKQYASLFGQKVPSYYYPASLNGGAKGFDAMEIARTVNVTASAIPNKTFSETNTQEKGVDEADLVETDGEFVYQVENQTLTIVDTRNPKDLKIASQKSLKDLGNIEGAYLYEDKLTVVSTSSNYAYFGGLSKISYPGPSYYEPTVNVSVFDVSNPNAVQLEETSKIEGTLLSSRAVKDKVYVLRLTFAHVAPHWH
jgi:uncharacterized secreted protein with C-terminal beta-propeller domain